MATPDVDNRLACFALGYLIRGHIEAIREAVDPEEKREFSEEYIRPETLDDVKDSIDALLLDIARASGPSACALDPADAEKWTQQIGEAVTADDGTAVLAILSEIGSSFPAPPKKGMPGQ